MSAKQDSGAAAGRTRRSVLRAVGLLVGALGAFAATAKEASAEELVGPFAAVAVPITCFLRGTRIRTSRGYRRIETVTAGDLVPTLFSGLTPILKIDSFVATRREALPVCITRSALEDNVPATNLWLTGSHAIYFDGVLISICNLVNGTTIAFDDKVSDDELEFFHIELAKHDVIDAEGVACESKLTPSMTRCAPRLCLNGGRSELRSRLRSAMAIVVDRRTPFDVVRDRLEERSLST